MSLKNVDTIIFDLNGTLYGRGIALRKNDSSKNPRIQLVEFRDFSV